MQQLYAEIARFIEEYPARIAMDKTEHGVVLDAELTRLLALLDKAFGEACADLPQD